MPDLAPSEEADSPSDERDELTLQLERERSYSERLRAALNEVRDELADRERSLFELRCERARAGSAVDAGTSGGSAAAVSTASERALAALADDVVGEARRLPSRSQQLEAGRLSLALADPPVPTLPLPVGPIARPDLCVASVLDEFSRLAFSYEADLVDLHPERWADQLAERRPALLLVESAWRGTGDVWAHKVSTPHDDTLSRLVASCRRAGIPTVFWNKEDPPNYDRFRHNAPLFDYVFTTDAGCVPRYRDAVGHDRVQVLPFAAQPRIHNPVRVPGGRTRSVAFAGTYYRNKHPNRKVQMQAVLDPARQFGLEIFSRVADRPAFAFPEQYQPHIVGTLPYADLLTAHKLYRAFVNVNSVVDSDSMCARRIFELLASGATVVSGVSPAIEALLGSGLVWQSMAPETTVRIFEQVLGDDEQRDRQAVRGLRAVMRDHTYGQRLAFVCEAVGLPVPEQDRSVTVVAAIDRPDQRDALLANVQRQTVPVDELLLVGTAAAEVARDMPAARAVAEPGSTRGMAFDAALQLATGAFVAFLEPDDFYAPAFLEDLLQAFRYTEADVVGKSCTAQFSDGEVRTVGDPAHEYDAVAAVHPSTVVVRRSRVAGVPWRPVADAAIDLFQRDCRRAGLGVFSADRFNFVGAARDGSVRVDGVDLSRYGAELERVSV